MKKAFFFAVSNNPNIDERCRKNYEYSNFVYSACLHSLNSLNNSLKNQEDKYDIELFKRHDMLIVDNIRDNVYKCMREYDTFIVLIDQDDGSYNANVWFELGIIATQKDKNIILISKDVEKRFPFYISDVDVIIIDTPLYKWFNNEDIRTRFDSVEMIMDSNKTLFDEMQDEDTIRSFFRFEKSLERKLACGKNPFETQVELSQLNALGYGNITKLFEESHIIDLIKKDATVAEFINGEEDAFNALVEAVKNAKYSLRTTRSANQSIVGHNTQQQYHIDFMNALYKKSKELKKFDRLICNNNFAKWLDVRDMLLYGGRNTRIFIRKRSYALGFELVVIDDAISFIHFYQLNDSSDYSTSSISSKPNIYNETINSTLKIKGSYVSKHLADLFDRFHHRDFKKIKPKNPSSTILGMPYDKDTPYIPTDIACLKLPDEILKKIDNETNVENNKNTINDYLWERFKSWHTQMSVKDRVIMGVGISALNPEKYVKKILEGMETYFPINNLTNKNDAERELKGRESYKNDLLKNNILTKTQLAEIEASLSKKTPKSYVIIQGKDVTEKDIRKALELDKKFYNIPDDEQFSIKKCLRWHNKTGKKIYTMLKDLNTDDIVGYINATPVNDKCYNEIRNGEYPDEKIDDNDIVAYENAYTIKTYNLYFASIVIDTDVDGFIRFKMLYDAFLDKLIDFTKGNILISRIVADAVSDSGKNMCKRIGMKEIKNTGHDNSIIYELNLYPLEIDNQLKEKIEQNHEKLVKKQEILYALLSEKYKEIGELKPQNN